MIHSASAVHGGITRAAQICGDVVAGKEHCLFAETPAGSWFTLDSDASRHPTVYVRLAQPVRLALHNGSGTFSAVLLRSGTLASVLLSKEVLHVMLERPWEQPVLRPLGDVPAGQQFCLLEEGQHGVEAEGPFVRLAHLVEPANGRLAEGALVALELTSGIPVAFRPTLGVTVLTSTSDADGNGRRC